MTSLKPSDEVTVLQALLDADGPIDRKVLRRRLPEGRTKPYASVQAAKRHRQGESHGSFNKITDGLQKLLWRYEHDGWIRRGAYIEVLDRAALTERLADRLQHPEYLSRRPRANIAELERQIRARNTPSD